MFCSLFLLIAIFPFLSVTKAQIDFQIFDISKLTVYLLEIPTSECKNQLISLGLAATRGEEWVTKMVDSMAKPQAGLLYGNVMHMGNYDECLEVDATADNRRIQGKYCSVFYEPHSVHGEALNAWFTNLIGNSSRIEGKREFIEAARFSYGLCVPKACSASDLQTIANIVEDKEKSVVHLTFDDDICEHAEGKPFTSLSIATIAIFSFFALLLVCGTAYDLLVYQRLPDDKKKPSLLVAFSTYTNSKKIFSTTVADSDLSCLNGLRVISMMWIVLAHHFQNAFFIPHINSSIIPDWVKEFEKCVILASAMAVDTFFTISGLLVVFLFLKSHYRGTKFNLPMFYFHRILRLTPSLAMIVLLTTDLFSYMGRGPLWPIVDETFKTPCKNQWWLTLIYMQNYVNTDEQCIGQSWYLAVDTQMYFISPIVFFALLRWPKRTITAVIVLIIANWAYVFAITWTEQLGTIFLNQNARQYKMLYVPTHVRGVAYLIGMVCGYFVYQTKTYKPYKLSKTAVLALWFSSLLVMIGIVIAHWSMASDHYDVVASSFFNAFTRICWSLALSTIILLCVNNYGGVINSILSNGLFNVLIRLNYSVYILHENVLGLVVAQERTPTYLSMFGEIHKFWGDYVFSLGAAYIWTLAFESPIIAIEKIIFGKKRKPVSPVSVDTMVTPTIIPRSSKVNNTENSLVLNIVKTQ